jgi:hypothetical protein
MDFEVTASPLDPSYTVRPLQRPQPPIAKNRITTSGGMLAAKSNVLDFRASTNMKFKGLN